MSDQKIPVQGLQFLAELTTTQVPIALSSSGAFAVSGNVATITFSSAHGLTFSPTAGTLPNYFGTFNGASAQTGVGTLNGPIFQIIAIPSTTTIQIYTTITAATLTSANFVPVFLVPFLGQNVSGFVNGPTNAAGTAVPPAWVGAGQVNALLGANCTIQYNPDNSSVIQGPGVPLTLATAPTYRNLVAASSGAQVWMSDVSIALFASGSAGTSRVSVIE